MEPTRPHLGVLAASAVLVAGAATALLGLLVTTDASEPGTPAQVTAASALQGVSEAGAPYAFWALDHRGGPLRWDACAPITFVLNPSDAPESAEADLRTALAILADTTGLALDLAGTTVEQPSTRRSLVEPSGAGWRWRPVLVAWSRPGEAGLGLTALDRGLALPVAVRDGEREAYVTGQIILNAARTDLVPGFADRRTALGATLLHELGHLLGLDHVTDDAQLMSVDPGSGPVTLADGDRAGLELLGQAAGCNPAPPASAGRGLSAGG